MSVALARKYRPKTFGDVAVQTHVATTLKGAIARGRVAHGYLLCGTRGTGKTTLARVLAMALNCEKKHERNDGEPCGECSSCKSIWAGSTSLDVVEIDAASNRGIDDARALRERATYAPSGDDRYKVYIVDEAHMLTREAWNVLLKILEEPPPRVVFVFATTEPQKIAQAAAPVLSRLQRFDLKRISIAEIRTRVTAILEAEGVAFESDAITMLARAADGSFRDALSLADQVLAFGDASLTAENVRSALGLVAEDELLTLFDIVAERKAADVFAASARLSDSGADYAILLTGFAEILRAQMAIELGGTPPEVGDRLLASLRERKGRIGATELVRMLSVLIEHEPIFRKSSQPQMLFESLLVRFALLDRTVELEEMLRAFGAGGREGETPAKREVIKPVQPADGKRQSLKDSASSRPPHVVAQKPAPRPAAPKPAASRPAVLADASVPQVVGSQPLDLNRMAERWDDIVAELRSAGRGKVAQLMDESTPAGVSASGVVTLDAETDLTLHGIAENELAILDALRKHFGGVTKLSMRLAGSTPRRRYDPDSVKAERVETLRQSDPLLAAAIETLDLELLD